MAVVWMILLHPNVHRFTEEQQREVIEWVYAQPVESRRCRWCRSRTTW